MEDAQITALYWARDETAIAESHAKYGRMLYGIAYHILSSHEDSEETVSSTYTRAWQTIPPQRPFSLAAYLGRIARNLSISRWRAGRAKKRGEGGALLLSELAECVPAQEDVARQAEEGHLARLLGDWLAALEQEDRVLFLRRYWFCTPVKDLAAQWGCTPSALSGRLYRLRQSLRKRLEQEGIGL